MICVSSVSQCLLKSLSRWSVTGTSDVPNVFQKGVPKTQAFRITQMAFLNAKPSLKETLPESLSSYLLAFLQEADRVWTCL